MDEEHDSTEHNEELSMKDDIEAEIDEEYSEKDEKTGKDKKKKNKDKKGYKTKNFLVNFKKPHLNFL